MRRKSSATTSGAVPLGALGVIGFSLSLPATRVAVQELDPWFVAFGRAAGAAVLAGICLWWVRAPRPTRAQVLRLAMVALGVVVGFPLFTSLALTTETSSHGAVVVTVLPAITAVFAVLRAGERPPLLFWPASLGGVLAVLTFLILTGTVSGGLTAADAYLLIGVALCGLGYAEGGVLARSLGGARTICWALVLAVPVTVPAAVVAGPARAGATAWTAFGYLTVISMFLAFFAWYAGLARGGIARVGQIQLAQPVLTLLWSALLLGEHIPASALAAAAAVLLCVIATQRVRGGVVRPRDRPGCGPPTAPPRAPSCASARPSR